MDGLAVPLVFAVDFNGVLCWRRCLRGIPSREFVASHRSVAFCLRLQFPSTLLTLNFGSNFNQSLENVTFPEADLLHPWYQVGLWWNPQISWVSYHGCGGMSIRLFSVAVFWWKKPGSWVLTHTIPIPTYDHFVPKQEWNSRTFLAHSARRAYWS